MLRRLESASLAFLGSSPLPAGLMKHADTRRLVPLVNSKMIGVVDGKDRGRNGNHASAILTGCNVCSVANAFFCSCGDGFSALI